MGWLESDFVLRREVLSVRGGDLHRRLWALAVNVPYKPTCDSCHTGGPRVGHRLALAPAEHGESYHGDVLLAVNR